MSDFSCQICMEDYTADMSILHPGCDHRHHLCRDCALAIMKTPPSRGNTFQCPTCRAVTPLRDFKFLSYEPSDNKFVELKLVPRRKAIKAFESAIQPA